MARGLSSHPPAASGTPLGLLKPIRQQHIQHVAEARSALTRGAAAMASRRCCAIGQAPRAAPPQAFAVQRFLLVSYMPLASISRAAAADAAVLPKAVTTPPEHPRARHRNMKRPEHRWAA